MLAGLGGQGRVAVGAMLGAAVAALCCLGLLTANGDDAAHAADPLRQAVRGASAAANELTPTPLPGAAAQGAVPTTTTVPLTATVPPPPTTTTTQPPPTTTKQKSAPPTFTMPSLPAPPEPTLPRHHHPCRWGFC